MTCINCDSNEVWQRVDIRGTARIQPDGSIASVVAYEVQCILFNECRDCGHRWEDRQ